MHKSDFPIFKNNPNLVYLDNAATLQRPATVLTAMLDFYEQCNASPLRGLYPLSVTATEKIHAVRSQIARFLHADRPEEIVFTMNATDSLNLIARAIEPGLSSDDDLIISLGEHHSNFLPWVDLCNRRGMTPTFLEPNPDGSFPTDSLQDYLTPNTRILATSLMSNATGALSDVRTAADLAHQVGALVVVDASQAILHTPLDIRELGADFLVFSGHKLGGPFGIGVLYGRYEILYHLLPAKSGGEMVESVTFNHKSHHLKIDYQLPPHKYEAGTTDPAAIAGLGAAFDYLDSLGWDQIYRSVEDLTAYAKQQLTEVQGLTLLAAQHGILSFNLAGTHPHDVAQALAEQDICVRGGYLCAQPLIDFLGGPLVRASLAFYNTKEDINALVTALRS